MSSTDTGSTDSDEPIPAPLQRQNAIRDLLQEKEGVIYFTTANDKVQMKGYTLGLASDGNKKTFDTNGLEKFDQASNSHTGGFIIPFMFNKLVSKNKKGKIVAI